MSQTDSSPRALWSIYQKHHMGCSNCSIASGPCEVGRDLKAAYEKAAAARKYGGK